MTPQGAKAKGRKFQQYIRDLLLETFPTLEEDDIKSTGMGQPGEDIQLSPAARKLFPYQIECKSKATSQIHTYYEQAKTHGKHEPIVFVKMDRKEPLAIVSAKHYMEVIKQFNEDRSNNS